MTVLGRHRRRAQVAGKPPRDACTVLDPVGYFPNLKRHNIKTILNDRTVVCDAFFTGGSIRCSEGPSDCGPDSDPCYTVVPCIPDESQLGWGGCSEVQIGFGFIFAAYVLFRIAGGAVRATARRADRGLRAPPHSHAHALGPIADLPCDHGHDKTSFLSRYQRSLGQFCCSGKGNPPPPIFHQLRDVGAVDLNAKSCSIRASGCLVVDDKALSAALVAVRHAAPHAFLYALAAGVVSQLRIHLRLVAFADEIWNIAESEVLASADIGKEMAYGHNFLSLDSLANNCWSVFGKLLFLPVFLCVYYLNNELAQWHKTCDKMRAVQASFLKITLMLSGNVRQHRAVAPNSVGAKRLFDVYRHMNLAHVLQYHCHETRLWVESGGKVDKDNLPVGHSDLSGFQTTGLCTARERQLLLASMGGERRQYGPSSMSRERDMVLAWLISDIEELCANIDDGTPPIIPSNLQIPLVTAVTTLRTDMQGMEDSLLDRPPITMVGVMRIFVQLLLVLGVFGSASENGFAKLGEDSVLDLRLLSHDKCSVRFYMVPMLAMGSISLFFFLMFTVVLLLYDPLGEDNDDLDVDVMLLSTEKSIYAVLRSRIQDTMEHGGDERARLQEDGGFTVNATHGRELTVDTEHGVRMPEHARGNGNEDDLDEL